MARKSSKLARALRRTFNMVREDAEATAKVVESAFRGEDEVNDEDLDREIRSLFYSLERENLLGIRRTEYKFEGQVRRAYFWRLDDRLEQWLRDAEERDEHGLGRDDLEALKIYRTLPPDLWSRGKSG